MAAPPSLKNRALRLLSGREYSRLELQQRLLAHEQEPGSLSALLDELEAKDFLSEKRALESLLHRRAPQWGGARIRQELQAKGLNAHAIAQAMQELRSTELERATAVWKKKFGAEHGTHAQRAKQMRFLSQRGFSAEVIHQVLRNATRVA